MLPIQKQFINYNKTKRSYKPTHIVIHSTGNKNDTAQNNHDYFASCNRGASADYFVDDKNIIQIIDSDNYYSWHCGDGRGAYGITNAKSIGIEMCGTANGQISDTTVNNTIELVKYLMNKYNIDADHVVRHYDASRKSCPYQFMSNNWARWISFKAKLTNVATTKYIVGWNSDSKGWWYSYDGNNYYKNCWKKIDNKYCYFDKEGYAMASDWVKDEDKWYYLDSDCYMVQAILPEIVKWKWIDGKCYCFGTDGHLYVSCKTYDGYTVDESGAWDRNEAK